MKNKNVLNIALSALFLALCMVLPFLTGQIPEIGKMLLPMHIPVLLCGLICGPQYGLIVGAIAPIMRSLIFSTPVMYPHAINMAFELAAYGFIIGLIYSKSKKKSIVTLYSSLIISMLLGRVVKGISQAILLGLGDQDFTISMFISGAFANAIPGIVLQLVLIPAVMLILNKTYFRNQNKKDG